MHHQRRKSGEKAVTVTDLSSRTKSSRPAMTRRNTPSHKLGKNPRDRERAMEDEYWLSDERESFPLFCMTCEKQFVPRDEKAIYCSEACRARDQGSSSATPRSHAQGVRTSPNYPFYAANDPEPRDIIPRASPSRPNSMYASPPASPHSSHHTAAISALRSLSIREPSPPSPASSYQTGMWPFSARSGMAASPGTSYGSRPASTVYSSTYESYGYTMTSPGTGDRPLPSRRPGAYSRPRSIELVTPMTNSR
ncbi:hypothetical protein N0V82_002869 [Gnomoniopsis sp. IMI 355080]|nr:hypothetical protein N0V82_002869 [Gnomoniopsis sp. IMI 355080]